MKTARQSLNLAFLKQKITRNEIDFFKNELNILFKNINENETEEFHKNLLSNFLNAIYYKDKHFINTKGKIDLVIYNEDAKSTAGVLLELKNIANKNEMITRCNLNKKAFQELLLYYLQERIIKKNNEIRHLIITNIYEWFIFDAQEFEKHFYNNSILQKQFNDFNSGTLAGTKNEVFYNEIAAPAIQEIQNKIIYTYFDIRHYKYFLNKGTNANNSSNKGLQPLVEVDTVSEENDEQLVELYKILSPEHLLKSPFANDANQLNNEFYEELLYIIGLEEILQDGKKLIVRKNEKERQNGTIIEQMIDKINKKNKLDNLQSAAFGKTKDEQLFGVALDLTITWINRILFLKLLESQILTYRDGDKNYAFLSTNKLTNYNDLDDLFFEVLAIEENQRNPNIKSKFENVPYLNSSLFEMTETEEKTFSIDSLQNDIYIEKHPKSVLNKENHSKGFHSKYSSKIPPLEYLLQFLDAFDFNSDGSKFIQEENKTLISASVLGLIFEKINGYKDGSFFTPSFITMYMCRETLSQTVIQKFNKYKNWNCKNIVEVHNSIASSKMEMEEANKIFNSIRICDPAVGSGHFLVSALNEMIYLKSELGILTDKNGKRIWEYSITVENDELIIDDVDREYFKYKIENKKSQTIQEAIFNEKQTIIENCLFGVDVNPNSVKICQLRLWIELLKHTYYIPKTNRLETLPNIDINIKCGNSLISKFPLKSEIFIKQKRIVNEYRKAVQKYKNSTDKEQKKEVTKLINALKNEFAEEAKKNDKLKTKLVETKNALANLENQLGAFANKPNKTTEQKIILLQNEIKKLEEQIEDKENNEYLFNAFEWRFEFPEVMDDDGNFIGFDVVIGNPPYIDYRKIDISQKKNLMNYRISNHSKMINLYTYFFERGIELTKQNGHIIFITPQQYLILDNCKGVRDLMRENTIISLSDFSNVKVFKEASTYPFITFIQKEKSKTSLIYYEFASSKNLDAPKRILKLPNPITEPVCISDYAEIIKKIENTKTTLKDISTNIFCASSSTLTLSNDKTKTPFITASDIQPYYLNEIKQFVDLKNYSKQSIQNQKGTVIYTSRMTKTIRACLIENNIFLGGKVNVIKTNKIFDLKFILGIINSKLINFWYREKYSMQHLQGGYLPVNTAEIEKIPVPTVSKKEQQSIVKLVDKILEKKKNGKETLNEEKEIDKIVYELYGLTVEEIAVVENRG